MRFQSSVFFDPEDPRNASTINRFDTLKRENPASAKRVREASERASALATIAPLSGPGLPVDEYLRAFLKEYNGRIFQGHGSQMPSSWNVLRAFVEPDEQALVLGLLSETIYSISLNDVLEFITDPDFSPSYEALIGDIDEFMIYELNVFGKFGDIRIIGNEDYAFCGCAFVREHDELSIMAVLGRHNPSPEIRRIQRADLTPPAGKEFLKNGSDEVDYSHESLFGQDDYRPVILLTRISLIDSAIQVRYVLQENKDTFDVASDDRNLFSDMQWDENNLEIFRNSCEQLSAFEDLFQLVNLVPFYLQRLALQEDNILVQRQPTNLRLQQASTQIKKAKRCLTLREAPAYVDVYSFLPTEQPGEASYRLPESGLHMETTGFWKGLSPNEIGKDKHGKSVIGRTWVVEERAWFAGPLSKGNPAEVSPISTGIRNEQEGEIYIMRSPSHQKDIFKVGFTTKSSDERAGQLAASSGQPDMFLVVDRWHVRNPREVERKAHDLLASYRLNQRREFFRVKYEVIRKAVEDAIRQSGAGID